MGRRYSPPSSNQDIEAKIRKVYDDINRLADQLAGVTNEGRRLTDGKEGDIRLVRDKNKDSFEIEGRFKEGYVRIGQASDKDKKVLTERFDSGDSGDTAPWQKVGEIGITVMVGLVTGLYVTGIGSNILTGASISVEDIISGLVIEFTLTQDYLIASSANIVEVQSQQLYLPIHVGSKVYLNS